MEFFCYIFRNFLARIGSEWNSELKFFSLFLGLYHPVLAENNAGNRFFNFLNFFAIFSEFSCLGRVRTEFGTKIFSLFLGLPQPFLHRNNAGIKFFNFLNFFAIFSEFSYPGWVWTEIGTKIFFSLSWAISSRFG